jgi:hypothetical protein
MKLKDITVLCSLMFFGCCLCACASDNSWIVAEQLDDVRGLTNCSFKKSKSDSYTYCDGNIKNIVISVGYSDFRPKSSYPNSMGSSYVYSYISKVYQAADDEIDELDFNVSLAQPNELAWKKDGYLYVDVKFIPINTKKIICVIFFDRNGNAGTDGYVKNNSKIRA